MISIIWLVNSHFLYFFFFVGDISLLAIRYGNYSVYARSPTVSW